MGQFDRICAIFQIILWVWSVFHTGYWLILTCITFFVTGYVEQRIAEHYLTISFAFCSILVAAEMLQSARKCILASCYGLQYEKNSHYYYGYFVYHSHNSLGSNHHHYAFVKDSYTVEKRTHHGQNAHNVINYKLHLLDRNDLLQVENIIVWV